MSGNSRQPFAFPLSGMLGGVSPTVLAHYNPTRPTIISADASNTGLGAVLFQVQDNGQRLPVCYASRSLSDTEKLYAVIEKEALATTWASERFSDYVVDIPFTLETDHKPLTVLLNSSGLSKIPPYPSFPPETYDIQLSSSICTRKTSSHSRYILTCSCWPTRARR